ncbi:MAG: response regulator transcription factor [Erysipelotrichales bacterium]|nr:response regulator transcription factor [Erysipelotrichales bacterium]
MKKQLIYTAEDDESIKELICYALTNEGYDVMAFSDADILLSECEKRIPDLILLDIMMSGTDGIEALKIFRGKYKSAGTAIIMLTAKASEINKITGLDAGADDYITKPFSVLELMARIRANLRKKTISISNNEIKVNSIILNQESRIVLVGEKKIALTNKEFELLKFLMLSVGNVVERELLLKEIWGYEYFGETRTIDIHMKNLREKLGVAGEAIQSIRGIGYILIQEQI